MVEVRKGADSPKPPQERGLQRRSYAAESAPTKSVRSNTSRRMKVLGDPVSRSATHLQGAMTSPPLCIAILAVKETSSSVTVPSTRQGPCSDNERTGSMPEAISKTSWLWSAGTSEKQVEHSEGRPWQALAADNEHACGADEISRIPPFPVGVRNRRGKAGCASPI